MGTSISFVRIAIASCALAGAAFVSPGVAQDRANTRPVANIPIVDPAIVGTWRGNQHIFWPVRFEIDAL